MNAHCPYSDCDEEFECWDSDLRPGDEEIVLCTKCNRKFRLRAEVSIDYYSEMITCDEKGEEHDWYDDPLTDYPDNKSCRKCKEMKD